jgi:hypothetical protein
MKINIANYEMFVLDYLEDNLSASELTAMRAFLKDHPSIEAEILELKEHWVEVEPDLSIVFEAKEQLLQRPQQAKIIWFHKSTFIRWASAAAAILLLLFGYGLGYFSVQQSTQPIVIIKHDTIFSPVVEQIMVQSPAVPLKTSQQSLKIENTRSTPTTINSLQPTTNREQTQNIAVVDIPESVSNENTGNLDTLQKRVTSFTTLSSKPILWIDESWNLRIPILSAESTIAQTDKYTRITKLIDYFVDRLPFQDVSRESFVPSYFLETGE